MSHPTIDYVLTPLPEKQGLKHTDYKYKQVNKIVLTPLPEKQGLKLYF